MELPKTAKYITGSKDHWIDIDGSVYFIKNEKVFKKTLQKIKGRKCCTVVYKEYPYKRSKKVDKLVAEAFIPNPDGSDRVGFMNGIKTDVRVENLYWIKDEPKKINGDGSVIMYETCSNKVLGEFKSIQEAAEKTGINESIIRRQSKYKRPVRKDFYFRYADENR